MQLFWSLVLILGSIQWAAGAGLSVAFEWKYLDWVSPNIELSGNNFTRGNAFTQDVDVDRRGRLFVTSPRWLEGVPFVLSLVTNLNGPGGPLLTPYPDRSWHSLSSCDSLISVYRMMIDECDRLWVVDTGRIRMQPTNCPSKILIFDLRTDQLIHKYEVPNDQVLNGQSSYVTPIVEIGETCLDAFLYVADVAQNGLLIYDLQQDRSWRLNNTLGNAFGPDNDAMFITIAGETFDLTDGTLGMSLSPKGFYDHRYLYFNSLASYRQNFASTVSLKQSEFVEPVIYQSNFRRQSQAGVQATSRRGVLFFQLVQLTAIACWDIEKPFIPENIVIIAQNEEALQYVSGIKVIVNPQGEEELWFNTNRLQKIINMTLKPYETNFRVIRGKVDDIIRGTNCEPSPFRRKYPDISTWHRI